MSSPVTTADLDLLLDTLLSTDADELALQRARELLAPQGDDVLDLWYAYVGSKPQLVGTSPVPTANLTPAISPRCVHGSGSGSSKLLAALQPGLVGPPSGDRSAPPFRGQEPHRWGRLALRPRTASLHRGT
jgi:hypothetical protein